MPPRFRASQARSTPSAKLSDRKPIPFSLKLFINTLTLERKTRDSSIQALWISCGQYVDIYRVVVDKYGECPALCVRLCAFCVRSVFCSGTVDSRQALARLTSGRS